MTFAAFALIGVQEIIPLLVFAGIVLGIWSILSMISQRNSRAAERLARISRPASLAEIEDPKLAKKERFQGVMETAKAFSKPLMPKTELEQNQLKIRLANAGFRSDSAVGVYLGIRFVSLLFFFILSLALFVPFYGIELKMETMQPLLIRVVLLTGIGFYLPQIILWWIRKKRQEEIFL